LQEQRICAAVSTTIVNALTVDVEDWIQSNFDHGAAITERVVVNTHRVLDLFESAGVQGTFFVQGMVAEAFPGLVRDIRSAGHEIGTHGYSHRSIIGMGPETFDRELRMAVSILRDITGEPVIGHRGPDFTLRPDTDWAFEILCRCGIRYDSTLYPFGPWRPWARRVPVHPHKICELGRRHLIEFPVATANFLGLRIPVGGGGYFRHYPYRIALWGIKKINRSGHPVILYMHPYEIDVKETRVLMRGKPWRDRYFSFKKGLFRTRVYSRYRRLLRKFRFAPAREVLGL
jgi:polysaccharide deacetylase family protein (PEP-CTERM system associated)